MRRDLLRDAVLGWMMPFRAAESIVWIAARTSGADAAGAFQARLTRVLISERTARFRAVRFTACRFRFSPDFVRLANQTPPPTKRGPL